MFGVVPRDLGPATRLLRKFPGFGGPDRGFSPDARRDIHSLSRGVRWGVSEKG